MYISKVKLSNSEYKYVIPFDPKEELIGCYDFLRVNHSVQNYAPWNTDILDKAHNLLSGIPTNKVVLDIGAHIGTFTSLAAVNEEHQFLAFEPNIESFIRLYATVKTNCWSNVSVFNVGIGQIKTDQDYSVANLKIPLSEVSGYSSFGDSDKLGLYKLQSAIILDLFPKAFSPDDIGLIKIDAEAHSVSALNALLGTIDLQTTKPPIIIELKGNELEYVSRILGLTGYACTPIGDKDEDYLFTI